jgi:catecholate siderophore receptor
VIPEQVIKDQGVTNLTDALKNVPGVGAFYAGENGSSTTGDAIFMRGVDTSNSIYVDGIRDIGSVTRDTFNTQQVEVIKGPAGTDYGRSAPSGSINMISKQPRLDSGIDGSASIGSAWSRRGTLDLNQAFSDNAAFRLNLMGKTHDAGRDSIENERYGIAPSLAFGLDTPTRLYLNYLHVRQNNTPDGGIPTVGLPGYSAPSPKYAALNSAGKVDTSNFYGTDSDYDKSTTDSGTLRFEHDLTDNTTVRNTTRWSRVKQEYLLTAVMGGASNITAPDINDVNTWSWSRLVNTKDVSNRILTNQTNITSTFNTGSIGHDVSAGVEFTRENQTNYGVNAMTAPAVNLYHPVSNLSIGGLDRNGANANGQTDTFGIYAFDTLTLTERIEVNGGLRLDNYHTKYDSATACGGSGRGAIACPPGQSTGSPVTTVDTAKSGNLVNWKAGALYRLTEQGNVYVNYAISQQPPGAAASPWPPAVAATAPTGPTLSRRRRNPASWAPSGKSSTSVCCSARRYSAPILKTKWPPTMTEPGRSTAKSAWRYELSATGNLTPDWTIIAGYTQQHATVTEGQNVAQDGSSAWPTPRNMPLRCGRSIRPPAICPSAAVCAMSEACAGAAMARSVPRITPRATGSPTPNWAIGSTATSICSSICTTCLIPITWPPSTRAAIAIIRANPVPLC